MPVATVLPAFDAELDAAGLVVAHNLEFDQAMMTAEFIRAGLPHRFDEVEGFCTMRGTTEFCHLTPKKYGEYKWPKLSELHAICTGKPHAGAHDAMGDAEAVVRCLRALQKAKALQTQRRAEGRVGQLERWAARPAWCPGRAASASRRLARLSSCIRAI